MTDHIQPYVARLIAGERAIGSSDEGTSYYQPVTLDGLREALEQFDHAVEMVVVGLEAPGPFAGPATEEWQKFVAGYLREARTKARAALSPPLPDNRTDVPR